MSPTPVGMSSTRKSSHLCELFVRGPMETPNKPVYLRCYWWLSTNRRSGPIAEATQGQLVVHGEVELVPIYSVLPYGLVFMALEGSLQSTKVEKSTSAQLQIF